MGGKLGSYCNDCGLDFFGEMSSYVAFSIMVCCAKKTLDQEKSFVCVCPCFCNHYCCFDLGDLWRVVNGE